MTDILIVGGGIAGLCLAQGLRRAGLGVTLFERDPSAAHRPQGYRISLKETGARALRACLPDHLFDLAVATSIRPATRMIFMEPDLRPKFAKDIPDQRPGLDGLGVNRLTLREILMTGLSGSVCFGMEYERYERLGDGRVRANFADGASVTGDLLVGADGVASRVRAQLLPGAVVDELDWALYGRTWITPGLLSTTPPELVDTFNRIIAPDGTAVSVATCRPLTPVPEAVARHAPGARLTDVPGSFSWTLSVPGPRPGGAPPAALHRLAVDTVRDWHEGVRRVVEEAEPSATFVSRTHSARRVEPWDEPAVTLVGDAVHSMSPGRGEGANVGLRDAHLLSDLLGGAGKPLAAAKAEYEHRMLDYAFAAVDASRDHPFAPFRRPSR
ncbi:FAD-dependent oxidoreductase [Nonomuraea phyllanthi]|uniref:FAD-dependent oxidoreductase n=1 Tax=Nonomuraea phyllanthi TaxID=2219224 RepID=A0A5C4V822_9ACTN|nr:NAD(P)/FAD-dependent oxidoreductase [Nonomuraea phyllanthi]KAB8187568.1 FAD-dependent oxidoreductase [Nonomuraea phyllanthi]QFY07000.1 FAD-dependent oxidoreductase [Nonomuraea phyllanthi]